VIWGTEGPEFKSRQPDKQFADQGRSLGAGPPEFVLALHVLLLGSAELFALKQESQRMPPN